MTTLPAEFLAAVIAAPDDDNPRLIAADWLDERGDVRGEFIRVQVELARTPEPAVTTQGRIAADDVDDMRSRCRRCREVPAGLCRWHELCRRERELLDRYTFGFIAAPSVPNRAWRLDSDPLCADDPAFLGCTFRRGFIESITCDWASWLIAHEHVYWHPAQPRDCPPGACPIRRVALTSGPVVRWTDATGRNEWCQLAAPDGTPVGDELRADSLADARQLLLARMWPGLTFELSARNGLDNHPEFTAPRRGVGRGHRRGTLTLNGVVYGVLAHARFVDDDGAAGFSIATTEGPTFIVREAGTDEWQLSFENTLDG
jgi:uncharacterized protein (TIGR02996 family)